MTTAEDEPQSILGGFIRAQRQMANLSLRQLSAMTKVSNPYLSQVERGLHEPSLPDLGHFWVSGRSASR